MEFCIDTFLFFSSFQICCSIVHGPALLLLSFYCPLDSLAFFWAVVYDLWYGLGVFFFVFIPLGVQWISHFGFKFLNYYFFKCIFFFFSVSVFSLSAFSTPFAWLLRHNIFLLVTEVLLILKPFYSLWASVWVVYMAMYMGTLMFSFQFLTTIKLIQ